MSDSIIIHHANCPDGMTSACVTRKSVRQMGFDPIMHAAVHNTEPPDVTGRDVYMVDFCYPTEIMHKIIEDCKSIIVLDHHHTSLKTFNTFSGDFDFADSIETGLKYSLSDDLKLVVIDENYCGAQLAAIFFDEQSKFINYIEDRDLWEHALEGTHEFTAALSSYPMEYDIWEELMEHPVERFISEGTPILRFKNQMIASQMKLAQEIKILGLTVLGAPAPYAIGSDLAGELAKISPSKVGIYWVDFPDNRRKFGLRSTPDGPNVAEMAEFWPSGGGHIHASGFEAYYDLGMYP